MACSLDDARIKMSSPRASVGSSSALRISIASFVIMQETVFSQVKYSAFLKLDMDAGMDTFDKDMGDTPDNPEDVSSDNEVELKGHDSAPEPSGIGVSSMKNPALERTMRPPSGTIYSSAGPKT